MNKICETGIDFMVRFIDPDGIPQEVSVARLACGSRAQMEYRGRPELVKQTKVALEQRLHDSAYNTAIGHTSAMAHFWRMLDEYENEVTHEEFENRKSLIEFRSPEAQNLEVPVIRVDSLSDLPEHTWHLFDYYLRRTAKAGDKARTIFSLARDVIDEAIRIKGLPPLIDHQLHVGTMKAPRLHADLDFEALRWLHKICIAEVRRADSLPRRKLFSGFDLGHEATVPNDWADTELGCRQMVFDHVRRLALGDNRLLPLNPYEFLPQNPVVRQRARKSGIDTQNLSSYIEALVPDKAEVLAAWILVAGRTGWLDALTNLSLSNHWVTKAKPTSAGERPKPRFQLSARRTKTGGFQTFTSTDGRYSPYRIIKRMEARTNLIRRVARERLARLTEGNHSLTDADQREIKRLKGLTESPFCYLSRTGGPESLNPLRQLFGSGMQAYKAPLKEIIERSGHKMLRNVEVTKREELIERIANIKLSDLRDAVADRVWAKTRSLYAVSAALGHSHVSVTAAYQNRRQKRLEAFVSFAKVMGILGDEIETGAGIDPRILHARILIGQEAALPPDIREQLKKGALPRGRVGIPCSDPRDPPNLGKSSKQSSLCTLDLCIICKHGLIVDDAPGVFEALARRLATLQLRMASIPLQDVNGSLEDFESVRIQEIVDAYYSDRKQEFDRLVASFGHQGE